MEWWTYEAAGVEDVVADERDAVVAGEKKLPVLHLEEAAEGIVLDERG